MPEIISTELRRRHSVADALEAAEKELTSGLLANLPDLKERDPDGYPALITNIGAVNVMVAAIEAGTPIAAGISIGLTQSGTGSVQTTITHDGCPGNCPNGMKILWVGESDVIKKRLAAAESGSDPLSMAPVDLAQFLVQLEIDAGAPWVGGPIDLLQLRPSGGPVWVRKKQGCPITEPAT